MTEADQATQRRAAVDRILTRDVASLTRGIQVVGVTADSVEVSMAVAEDDANGVSIAHGGIAYFLADTAVGLAVNSRDDGAHVTASATITYLAPGRVSVLRAVCRARGPRGRTSVYTVNVIAPDGVTIAVMQETLTRLRGPLPENGEAY